MKLEPATMEALKGIKAYLESVILWLLMFAALYFGIKWLLAYDPILARVAGAALVVAAVSAWWPRGAKAKPTAETPALQAES